MNESETRELIGRIPLTSICTLNGARVDDLIVAVMVEDLDRLEARAEAAERVVAQLTEDIERRLVMGVGTISSQHVLRMIGRPWTFEDVSERRLHGRETISSE